MNPPLPLPQLLTLLVIVIGLILFASWRSTHGLSRWRRGGLLALRAAFLCALGAILLNPGRWVKPSDRVSRPWIILVDQSESMMRNLAQGTRFDQARELATLATQHAKDGGLSVRVHPFDASLHAAVETLPTTAEGPASKIRSAVDAAFQETAAAGEAPAAVLVLSDGRGTENTKTLEALALRAQARQIPVHTVAIGADSPVPDLSVRAGRASIQVFAKQTVHVPVVVEAQGLGPLRPQLQLLDAHGKVLAERAVDVTDGGRVVTTFEVPAPEASARWSLAIAVQPNEARHGNNRGTVSIRVLNAKTRVFLAEGAPYWDSKFLAQLLRQQSHMEVHSVHRLSEQRYFRIDSGQADPTESATATFPESLDELSRYDLVLLGKNIDGFMTPARMEALRQYVRDHGGAVLFCRGKAATSELPGIETLEPVAWGNTLSTEFRFSPTAEGAAAGLFGETLPAPDDAMWSALPPLKDGRALASIKPFTRILAAGTPVTTSSGGKFPVLLVRRYGQGVTGLANGDGLWKWDFFPEARELGNMYEEFWSQWLQWLASYSEFLPGHDFSLRLPALHGEAGQAVPITIAYRGKGMPPTPKLLISNGSSAMDLVPAPLHDASGRPQWRATFTPPASGTWRVKLIDDRPNAVPTPEADLVVPDAPAESDDLSPDPEFLAALSSATAGKALDAEQAKTFFASSMTADPPLTRENGAEWQPSWTRPWLAILLAFLPASEWFFRRRQGLA